ncbi:GIY-YIG nuclease family protein [Priestia megaterium]
MNSHKKIKIKCDYCGKDFKREYRRHLEVTTNSEIDKDSCRKCLKLKNIEAFINSIDCSQRELILKKSLEADKIKGVYALLHKSKNKTYIGSSKDIILRWKSHILDIKNHSHSCKELNCLDIDELEFIVLEMTEKDSIVDLEYKYIQLFKSNNPEYGYNIIHKRKVDEPIINNSKGINKTENSGKLSSVEVSQIKKDIIDGMSLDVIARRYEVNPSTISDIKNLRSWVDTESNLNESLKNTTVNVKGVKNACSKLTENQVIEIKTLLNKGGKTMTEIANMFGVSRTLIGHIKRNKLWSHISI